MKPTCPICGHPQHIQRDCRVVVRQRAELAEMEVRELRALLSRIHEDALYKNECTWCHEDPADEHSEFVDEDGDRHPCFGQDVHEAIRKRSTSPLPPGPDDKA